MYIPRLGCALHPGAGQYPIQIALNTCQALGNVIGVFDKWLQNLRPRLLNQKDWTAAESVLAEIRACGTLLGAGYPVILGGKNDDTGAKPEFHITLDGIETIVEVWNRNRPANFVTASGTMTPFGAPDPEKDGDSNAKMNIERFGCFLIRIIEKYLLHKLSSVRRQLRKGIEVTLKAGCARPDGFRNYLATLSRVHNELAARVRPLFQVEGTYEVVVSRGAHPPSISQTAIMRRPYLRSHKTPCGYWAKSPVPEGETPEHI